MKKIALLFSLMLLGVFSLFSALAEGTDTTIWTPSAYLRHWVDVDASEDCRYITVVPWEGYACRSDDYGATWKNTFDKRYYQTISISDTGDYQIMYADYLMVSRDYGVTWKLNQTAPKNKFLSDISGDAKYQLVAGGSIHLSVDSGLSWKQLKSLGTRSWGGLKIVDHGRVMAATSGKEYQNDSVYVSRDYGDTWSGVEGLGSSWWGDIAITPDSRYWTIIERGDKRNIWTSDDYGFTWKKVNSYYILTHEGRWHTDWYGSNFTGVDMSDDGKDRTAVTDGWGLYTSSNYGVDWKEMPADGRDWLKTKMSGDGSHRIAVGGSSGHWEYIYQSLSDSTLRLSLVSKEADTISPLLAIGPMCISPIGIIPDIDSIVAMEPDSIFSIDFSDTPAIVVINPIDPSFPKKSEEESNDSLGIDKPSEIVSSIKNNQTEKRFIVLPNRLVGGVTLCFSANCRSTKIRIFNLNGTIVRNDQRAVVKGSRLDYQLQAGAYLIAINLGGASESAKIIIK